MKRDSGNRHEVDQESENEQEKVSGHRQLGPGGGYMELSPVATVVFKVGQNQVLADAR
jgi:hypothetical protein